MKSGKSGRSWTWRAYRRLGVVVVTASGLIVGHLAMDAQPAAANDNVETLADNTPCLQNDPVYAPVGDSCAAWNRFERAAVDEVIPLRGIEPLDQAMAQISADSDVRSVLYGKMVAAARKPAADRTTDEQTIVTWLQNVQRRQNIAIAQASLDEFRTYNGPDGNTIRGPGWCTYTPPAPYQADRPAWSECVDGRNPAGDLFTLPPAYPQAETWVKWGTAKVKKTSFTLDSYEAATEMSASAAAGVAAASAGVAAGGTVAALTAALGPTFIATITPYAVIGFPTTIVSVGVTQGAAIATATASMFAAAAFVVVVVAVALYGIIFSGLRALERQNILTELRDGLATAQAAGLPDLTPYLSGDGSKALYELMSPWLNQSEEWHPNPVMPGRSPNDVVFRQDGGLPNTTASVRNWSGEPTTIEMRSGFLVVDGVPSTIAKVLDSDGKPVYVVRSRKADMQWGFIQIPADTVAGSCLTTTAVNCPIAPSLKVLNGAGQASTIAFEDDEAPRIVAVSRSSVATVGRTFEFQATSTWKGRDLTAQIAWWVEEPARHPFTTTSVCDPLDAVTGPVAGTERFNGICYRRTTTTGGAFTYNLTTTARFVRAVSTSPSAVDGWHIERVSLPVAAPSVDATGPATSPEGSNYRVTGTITDASGSAEPLTLRFAWSDGVVNTFNLPAAGTTIVAAFLNYSRSGDVTTFSFERYFPEQTSASVTVRASDETATSEVTIPFTVLNAAPVVDRLELASCAGNVQCPMTPGLTYTLQGRITDLGIQDTLSGSVAIGGAPAIPLVVEPEPGFALFQPKG